MLFKRFSSRKLVGATALTAALILSAALAYAVDALVIEEDGTIRIAKSLNFGQHLGELITLYEPNYAIGMQWETLYARSRKRFAWYQGGKHVDTKVDPGEGGTKVMELTDGTLNVKNSIESGRFVGMGAVPLGAILMWSGDREKVPAGWRLAEGGGTVNSVQIPDLRGRFIVGANTSENRASEPLQTYEIGAKQENDTVSLTVAQMPPHTHKTKYRLFGWRGFWGGGASSYDGFRPSASGNPDGNEFAATVDDTGEGKPFDNRPSYYALAFIIYVGQ